MKWQMHKMKMQEIAIDFLLWCGCVTLISTVWEVIEICYPKGDMLCHDR